MSEASGPPSRKKKSSSENLDDESGGIEGGARSPTRAAGDEKLTRLKRRKLAAPPRVIRGMVDFALEPINQYLTCKLCNGYYRDPVTITECLHTFCKSCLLFAFSTQLKSCPTCKIDLGTDPFKVVLEDRQMQEMINKVLFPEIAEDDAEEEREFYARLGIRLKPEFRTQDEKKQPASYALHKSYALKQPVDIVGDEGDDDGAESEEDTQVEFNLQPDSHTLLGELRRPYLCTSGRFRVRHAKKYISASLSSDYAVDPSSLQVICREQQLNNGQTMTSVYETIWKNDQADADDVMVLTYRLPP